MGCLIPRFGLVCCDAGLVFGFGLRYLWFCGFGGGFWGFALGFGFPVALEFRLWVRIQLWLGFGFSSFGFVYFVGL